MKRLSKLLLPIILLAGCTTLSLRDPLNVSVAGLDPAPGEGLEARFLLKLRVQNPNDVALNYNGLSVDLDLAGRDFATGVMNTPGEVPRFGEALIEVPVTVPVTAILGQVLELTRGNRNEAIGYRLRGRLGGIGIGGVRFDTEGELRLPKLQQRP